MVPMRAREAGWAFGEFVGAGRVVVGRDSRPSGKVLANAAIEGLTQTGCTVVDLGLVTTPGVALMVCKLHADGGIVITASHNPAQYNGIKFLTSKGCAPNKKIADDILARFHALHNTQSVPRHKMVGQQNEAGHQNGGIEMDESTHVRHVQSVLDTVNVERIRAKRFTVVLDSVNGAGGLSGRALLEALGCAVTHLGAEPTGQFAHLPEPIAENLTGLAAAVADSDAVIGFAQDPDADRLAIVDETGCYLGEEYTLVLAAMNLLNKRAGQVVVNVSTSRMIDDIVGQMDGCSVARSAVGEANVVELMQSQYEPTSRRQASEQTCVVGGEGNGGVIDPRVVLVRDSLVAMAQTLELLADRDQPLSHLIDTIPRYAMIKRKFDCTSERVPDLLRTVRQAYAGERINDLDGVRVDRPDGWFHIRASNTEPVVRIIAEAADEATAKQMVDEVGRAIGQC